MPALKKKVLIITYYFPPSGGAGVQRTLRFLNNLSQLGWESVILTVRNGDYPTIDNSLIKKVPPQTSIYRTFIPEPYSLYRKFTGRKIGEAIDLSTLSIDEQGTVSLKEKIAIFLRTWLFIPDARIGWFPFAFFKGLRVIRKEKIDLVFSTGPPNTVHIIAGALKFVTGKKWVADFRDPWFKYLVPKRNSIIPLKIDSALNKLVLNHADSLTWVCEGIKKETEKTSGIKIQTKNIIITNGFNELDFENLPSNSSNKFILTYVGSLFVRYDLTCFIRAIENIYSKHTNFREDLEMVFYGTVDSDVEMKFRNSEFHQNIRFMGYQNHKQTLTNMVSSTLLLLYIIDSPQGKNIPTSKLFEYIGAKRPILALAPQDSEAARIINKTKSGIIIQPDDSITIEKEVLFLYQQWSRSKQLVLDYDTNAIKQFEIKNLTKRMVDVWDANLD